MSSLDYSDVGVLIDVYFFIIRRSNFSTGSLSNSSNYQAKINCRAYTLGIRLAKLAKARIRFEKGAVCSRSELPGAKGNIKLKYVPRWLL